MADGSAGRFYDLMKKHRRRVLVLLLVVILAAVAGLFFVDYDNAMDTILPRDEVITRSMDFFRTSDLAGKVVISFSLNDPAATTGDLLRAVDGVAASLDPVLFPEVLEGFSEARLASDMDDLFRNLPGMISRDDLAWIDGQLNRTAVAGRLRTAYLQLLKPEGLFMNSMLRSDPLGLRTAVLRKLNALSASTGYDVEIRDGHFISRDGRHSMIIAKSSVAVTDAAGSRRMMASLDKSLSSLPASVTADVISGHVHTLSNEKLIKRDIAVVSIIATAAFLILFGYLIRDINALFIFIVPVVAILIAVNLTSLLIGSLSYWVIGLGSTVAGITIDYGTHIYFAGRGRSDPDGAVKHLIRPVGYGALTTVAVFLALFFSEIKGYQEMALFSIISVVLSTALSLFVLPHVLYRGNRQEGFAERVSAAVETWKFDMPGAVLIWIIGTVVLAAFASQVRFENSIRNMDGTEKRYLQAEERFHKVWGGEKAPAVFVASAGSYEQALSLNERVYADAAGALGPDEFVSLASIWPSAATRRENAARWKAFWSGGREQKLKRLLAEEGGRYGFSKDAFAPFFDGLKRDEANGTGPGFGLAERFIQKTRDGYRVMSFFPDNEKDVEAMDGISRRHPGTYVVSSTMLSRTMARIVSADLKRMSLIAAAGVVLLTYFCFFNIRETLIALVPPVTGIVWLLGFTAVFGLTVNLANMMAGVLAIGLTSDYGIFMTFHSREGERKAGTVLAITLCTVSTLIGAGVLVFARHPALSSVGTTMLIGVGSGFLSAIYVVPRLCGPAASGGKAVAA